MFIPNDHVPGGRKDKKKQSAQERRQSRDTNTCRYVLYRGHRMSTADCLGACVNEHTIFLRCPLATWRP